MERRPRESLATRLCKNLFLLLRQFILLLGKNFLLQIRRPIGTAFEIFIPIVAVTVLAAFRLGIPSLGTTKQCFRTFGSDPLIIPATHDRTVYYAPNDTDEVQIIANALESKLALSNVELVGVATEDEMVSIILNNSHGYWTGLCQPTSGGGVVGVVFDELNSSDIRYTIRMNPEKSWNTDSTFPVFVDGAQTDNVYLSTGFMQLEKAIDESIIEWKSGSSFTANVSVRQFPYPGYNRNIFLQVLEVFLPFVFVCGLMFSVGMFVRELVLEKETRMKETMRMMGLSNWVLIATWFFKQMLFYLGPLLVMTILLKYGKIYPQSNIFLLFVLMVFYFMTAVAFSFLISVFFTSARLGMFAGFICWFLFFFPYFFLQPRYSSLSFGTKMGTSLISNVCIGYAIQVLTSLEVQEDGLQFSNLASPISVADDLSMGWLMLMMLVDTILYMLLYWYIDAVFPGKYGTPKPLYFPFVPSFWLGNVAQRKVKSTDIKSYTNPVYDASAHEAEPIDEEVGISIDGLTKIYSGDFTSKKKLAVNNLSLNMFKGQITALLGHNGAGKTTTMSILTGLYTPTAGHAYINGYSVQTEMDLIRRSLGICPQHNVLFDRLTVSEHLSFFSMLKGMPTSQVKAEVNQMIADLQLVDKKGTRAKNLSGGMKRKLSVGIALVGQSEVVILDEPTSGMDPYARRATWDLLTKHKQGRTMLLTTHFMDEADLLGDRIAIMAEGRLKCSGSSLFLKTRFGVGYHMTIVKEPGCNSRRIIDIVRQMVTDSEEVTDIGAELSFILPSQYTNQFPDLFDRLEREKDELGISSFGVSITTMEEVFIKVGHGDDATMESKKAVLLRSQSKVDQSTTAATNSLMNSKVPKKGLSLEEDIEQQNKHSDAAATLNVSLELDHESSSQKDSSSNIEMTVENSVDQYGTFQSSPYKPNTGVILWFQQILGIFVKHSLHALRFWASVIWQLIIPLSFVVLSLVLIKTIPKSNDGNPGRLLSVSNSAPIKGIDFFSANLNGLSFPFTFEAKDIESLGVSTLHNYTDDINEIKRQVGNYTSVDQCCDYRYQILDKFCASRTVGNIYKECKNSDSFAYSTCTDCLKCKGLYKDSTCTDPTSYSYDYDYGDGCPVSPPISYTDLEQGNLKGSLDDYDTYVIEKLLQVSGQYVNPTSFFRKYQGGFVIYPETATYSLCACNSTQESEICSAFSPTLSYNYPPKDPVAFVEDSLRLLNGDDSVCRDPLFNYTNPNCSSSSDGWNYDYNWAVKACIDSSEPFFCDCSYDENLGECDQYVGTVTQTTSTTSETKITIWYNNQPYHMAPAVLNNFYSLYLKQKTGDTISVVNRPLPKTSTDQVYNIDSDASLSYIVSFIAVFGTCFLFSSFVIFLIKEKETKAKHIQFVSGVSASSYWIGTFLFDILNALVPTILIVIIFAAFNVVGFRHENLAAIFILFFLSSWAAIPISYIFSFIFTNSLIAFAILIIFHYFVFFVLQLTVVLVSEHKQKILYYIFLLHPTYGLGNGLADMYSNQFYKEECTKTPQLEQQCKEYGITYMDSIFSFKRPGINYTFIYLFLEGIILMILTILIERQFFIPEIRRAIQFLFSRRQTYQFIQENEDPDEDSDVSAERAKVHSMEQMTSDDVVVIKDLEKVYKGVIPLLFPCVPYCRRKYKTAVNGINLAIPTGECFGLLGVNGAGKTTTFNILTGDLNATNGSATISGYSVSTQLRQVQKRIGYCPQFDAIIELLTGKELLTMFARLRGIPERHIKSAVEFEIRRLDLTQHANKRSGNYSGGNKRKLSTAIALIGNPSILFLDEPTTGMDPVTRRFLWDAIISIVHEGRSVILTSHSMEECEALCSRLAIMVNGKFKCLGSTQHLKSKYGSGYTMQLQVSEQQEIPANEQTNYPHPMTSSATAATVQQPPPQLLITGTTRIDAIHRFVTTEFPNSYLLEAHQSSVSYHIPAGGVTWSAMFRKIEDNKSRFGIINYSISQTTLDQVFINFAKAQEDASNW